MNDFESLKTFVISKEELEERTEIIPGDQGRVWFDRTGYHMTEEEKKHLSEVTKGVPKSLEHRKAISRGATGNTNWLGKNHSEESKQKMRKPKSLEHRKAISEAKKDKPGVIPSDETRRKMAESQKQWWMKRRETCQY
jgi:hypothetical protein